MENDNDDFEADPTCVIDIDEVISQASETVSDYERRRIKEADRWKSLQDEVVKTYVERSVMPPNQCCVKCCEDGKPEVDAIMRCVHCGPWQFFCTDCAETLHRTRNQFHIVEVWKVGITRSQLLILYEVTIWPAAGQAVKVLKKLNGRHVLTFVRMSYIYCFTESQVLREPLYLLQIKINDYL